MVLDHHRTPAGLSARQARLRRRGGRRDRDRRSTQTMIEYGRGIGPDYAGVGWTILYDPPG